MTSFLLFISLTLAFFSSSQADLIGDICSKSVNPTLCNSSLRSDPRSRGADLRALANIAIDQSIAATTATVNVATSLESGPSKQKASACADSSNKAIGILSQVRGSLGRGGIGLSTQVNSAFSDISICESEFGRDLPPQLKNATFKALGLVNVVSVIVNCL